MELNPGYRRTDVGIIPDDWKVAGVSMMGEVRAGKALAARGPGEQRPYLRTKNVLDGRIDLDDVLSMPMTDAEFFRYGLREGDVLLNEGQTTELVGRCAIYSDEFGGPCAIQNQLVRFRAKCGVDALFASHLFRRCQKDGTFASIATQTTSVAHLGVSRFQRLELAWPSALVEQEAIAEALSDADALIESLEQLVAKKRQVKQGVMQELLTGRTRLPGFSGEWKPTKLGRLGDWFSGGTPSKATAELWSGDIPWVSPKDMKRLNLSDAIDHVSPKALGRGTRLLPAGALLIVVRGMILAHSAPVARADVSLAFNQDIKALVVRDRVDSRFVLWWLAANENLLLSKKTESTHGTKRIPTESLFDIEIGLPEPNEQAAIAAVLSDIESEIVAMQGKIDKARLLKQGMMQELLTGRIRLV